MGLIARMTQNHPQVVGACPLLTVQCPGHRPHRSKSCFKIERPEYHPLKETLRRKSYKLVRLELCYYILEYALRCQ